MIDEVHYLVFNCVEFVDVWNLKHIILC